MPLSPHSRLSDRKRILFRLLWLRVIVLVAAVGVLLFYQLYLARALPYTLLYCVLLAAFVFSAFTWRSVHSAVTISNWVLLLQLLADMLVVITLVTFSGRSGNPFIYYLLVPVAIGATLFSRSLSWMLVGVAVTAYSVLLFLDMSKHLHHLNEFQLHLFGMWVNFVGSALLINAFVSTLAMALRDRELKLARAREQTLKNEQLIGIGTLAASTVHALGSPLSTMAVILGEMKNETYAEQEAKQSNITLLLAQIQRCKQTLNNLSQLAEIQRKHETPVPISELVEALVEHYQLINPKIMPRFIIADTLSNCALVDSVLLQHALINLIDNAISAAYSSVDVTIDINCHDQQLLSIVVVDDGPGLAPEEIDDYGKPMLSRNEGLGIGVFLANSTIEKLKGEIVLYNPDKSTSGKTTVVVNLPMVKTCARESNEQ